MKRKHFALFILIVFSLVIATKSIAQNAIQWGPGVKVSWDDFQGAPDASSSFSAYTAYELPYKYGWDGTGKIKIEVWSQFMRGRSWKKPKDNQAALLMHEQKHFDIAEIYARVMRKEYAAYTLLHKHTDNTAAEIKAISDKILQYNYAMQDKYDNE